jgi:hypothetical protein
MLVTSDSYLFRILLREIVDTGPYPLCAPYRPSFSR